MKKANQIITDIVLTREFNKYKIAYSERVFTFKPNYSDRKEVKIQLDELKNVRLEKSKPRAIKVIPFWISRILTFDTFTETSWFEYWLEYRFDYDLIFELNNGREHRKIIKHFDMFLNKRIMERLNSLIDPA